MIHIANDNKERLFVIVDTRNLVVYVIPILVFAYVVVITMNHDYLWLFCCSCVLQING